MSTIAIVLIAVGVLLLIGLILYATVLSPKKRRERRLAQKREQAATHHREVASKHHTEASVAEQKAEEARLKAERAKHEADVKRKEATVHEGRADLHDQGLADDELHRFEDGDQHTEQNGHGRFDSSTREGRTAEQPPPPRR